MTHPCLEYAWEPQLGEHREEVTPVADVVELWHADADPRRDAIQRELVHELRVDPIVRLEAAQVPGQGSAMLCQPLARRIGARQDDAATRRRQVAERVVPRLGIPEQLGKHDAIHPAARRDVAVLGAREHVDIDPIAVQGTCHRQTPVVGLQDDRAR